MILNSVSSIFVATDSVTAFSSWGDVKARQKKREHHDAEEIPKAMGYDWRKNVVICSVIKIANHHCFEGYWEYPVKAR
jgi:hypothetical protein